VPANPAIEKLLSASDRVVRGNQVTIALALFLATLTLAGSAVVRKSVTVDEFQLLPHGLAILRTGDFHLDPGVPPLANELSAFPLLLSSAHFDRSRHASLATTWEGGRQFMEDNTEHYHRYFLLGRAVSIAFLLATCLLTYGLARSLYGGGGGLLAAAVVAASPNLLAHGALTTPDIYLTAGLIGSLWAFDGVLRRPGWTNAVALGVMLGMASLAKFTGLLLMPILLMMLAALQLSDRLRKDTDQTVRVSWRRAWLAAGAALVVALLLINLAYLGSGSCTPLEHYRFTTGLFQGVQRVLGFVPMPLPAPFVQAMDTQLGETGYTAYLLGEFNETGFFQYYLVGLLVKTPVVVLLLCVLAFVCQRRLARREIPMVVTAALIFGFFSLTRHKNIGMRYVLFLEPIMAVWVGRLASLAAWTAPWQRSRLAWLTGAGVLCLWFTSVTAWPDYLAYFNWISGGPDNGHKYLLDSNLDWGQDLIALRDYMAREGIAAVDLAYFGRVDPKVYDIAYNHLGTRTDPRYVAISANLLWGRMYFVNGTNFWPPDRDHYALFRRLRPKTILGHSIYVYDMEHTMPLAGD
jgi:hypothetical protein